MNPRTITFLLLLTSTVMAVPPKHPDPPAGRQAFNQCMDHAETAWKNGRTSEALRWYHTGKKVARAHNLTLTERDEALTAYVARHEAGLTGPQPGKKPGCDTDGGARTASKPKAKTAKRVPPTTRSRSFATKTIPVPEKQTLPSSENTRRSIPETRTARSLSLTGAPKAKATTKRPATTTPKLSPAPKKQPEKTTGTVDSDLVPPITSPETKLNTPEPPPADIPAKDVPAKDAPAEDKAAGAPAAGTSVPIATKDKPSSASLPPVSKTSATDEADITDQPVKLTVDQSVVPLKIIPEDHKSDMAARPISPEPLTEEAATESLPIPENTAADHQLTLLMFGPIVVALFILGLLTHEMPGPKRILAWATRRNTEPIPMVDDAPLVSKTISERIETTGDMLTVTLGTRRRNKVEYYTATIELPGLEPTRLVKRRDGSPLFRSRAAAISSARALARRIGYDGITEPASRRKAA